MDFSPFTLPEAGRPRGQWLVSPRFDQVNIRQLEYHPTHDALMAVGTTDGEVMVVDHNKNEIECYSAECAADAEDSVLGLCWYVSCTRWQNLLRAVSHLIPQATQNPAMLSERICPWEATCQYHPRLGDTAVCHLNVYRGEGFLDRVARGN
mgnify:CR=1 FL=1